MKLSSARIDSARLEAGDWIGDIPGMGDLRLKVRGMSNKDAMRLRSRLVDALPREKKLGGKLDPDTAEQVDNEVIVGAVLYGWENLTDDDGKPIPFSADRALAILSDPDMLVFKGAVRTAADSLAEVQAVAREGDVGNSAAPSNGASNGVATNNPSTT